MRKLAAIAIPLLLYAVFVVASAWRGKAPSRHALNVHTSVLLMVYLLATAGLGIFWVANQQLPVFDLHYLFGYATLLLVGVHLTFNLPVVGRYLRKLRERQVRERQLREREGTSGEREAPLARSRRPTSATIWRAAVGLVVVVGAFLLGMRHGGSEVNVRWGDGKGTTQSGALDAIVKYHEFSAASRRGIFARAPGIEWGERPPPFKAYPDADTVSLGSRHRESLAARSLYDALRGPSPKAVALDAPTLGALLFAGAGVTQRERAVALRASPSSGALFSSELYVLVWQVDGLAPGTYHYDADAHRLHVVRREAPPRELAGVPATAPLAIVATSIFRRTGFKYRDRAYRYAVADTGHLLENLRIAAAEAGLVADPLPRFDDAAIEALLGVDGAEEGVLAVVPLGTEPSSPLPWATFGSPTPPTDSVVGVTGLAHRATSLRSAPEPDDGLPLPAARATSARPALEVIRARRSHRRFADTALSDVELATVLGDAAQAPRLSSALQIHVVIDRVSNVPPGVYRYHPRRHRLHSIRAGALAAQARTAALDQDVIGGAAAVIVLSAHKETMFAEGARGYRHAFLEAGMFSERVLLSAVSLELGACPVGAFYDDDASRLVGVEPSEVWVLHFIALGPAG